MILYIYISILFIAVIQCVLYTQYWTDKISDGSHIQNIIDASAGNRTRAARVAGEHSTTEPPMLLGWYF